MKTIKVILIIISVFILGFLGTGFVVSETNYNAKISLDHSLEVVFNNFTELDSIQNWMSDIDAVTSLNKSPKIVGDLYGIIVINQGQEIRMTKKVTRYVANEKLTLYYDAENMLKKEDFIFSSENGKTIITLHASCRSESFLMGCMFPYFKTTFRNQDQAYLESFKTYMEETKPNF
jgi:uncharacterized membrane protein